MPIPSRQPRRAVQHEKIEQQQIVNLLRSVGARVYVLGTRRPRGDFRGTCQTPGLPDLLAFLPERPRPDGAIALAVAVWIEVKAAGGRPSVDQLIFEDQCCATRTPYLCGGVQVVIDWLVAGGRLKPESLPHYRQPKGAPDDE